MQQIKHRTSLFLNLRCTVPWIKNKVGSTNDKLNIAEDQ